VASGCNDHNVRLWDVHTGNLLLNLEGHVAGVVSMSWSPDGKQLASGSSEGTVRLWETDTGALMRNFEGHADKVRSVAWSADGRQLASDSLGSIILWRTETREKLLTIEELSDGGWVAIHSNNRYTGNDSGIHRLTFADPNSWALYPADVFLELEITPDNPLQL
jgi:WD40 repeat protein